MEITAFAGKRVVVMGLGHFGGGIAVSRWLVSQRARVTVTDSAEAEKLAEGVQALSSLPITFHLGGHRLADLDDCELLVVSPAVPKEKSPFVAEAVRRGIPLTSEMNLFIERCQARRVIGITGSAGKSTTTAMLGSILERGLPGGAQGRGWIGGNIGRSLLPELDRIAPEDMVALELSSFQLEDLGRLRWSPQLALITNIQPNHLDRHGTLEAYADAKLNIVRYQTADGRVFIREEDEELAQRVRVIGAGDRLVRYAFDARFDNTLRLPGRHNRENAAGAVALARALGIPDERIREGLIRFTGLPHRLELVGEIDGVRFFNDSKSTTAESARIAIDAFDEPVVMLVGGRGKGAPFDGLSRHLAARAKAVIPYGETGAIFEEQVTRFARELGRGVMVRVAGTFEEAVQSARGLATAGDVVVLSPACTSYDLFSNYEERGDAFRRLVQEMTRNSGTGAG